MSQDDEYYLLDPEHTDPARVKREREKARKLRQSGWWKEQVARGICHYCGKRVASSRITMDHVVPIARGGTSTQGNVVPACQDCNRDKKLDTPVDRLLRQIAGEKRNGNGEGGGNGGEGGV